MSPETEALVIDLVEWVAKQPRDYTDVMDAWRTSCPRLPVWEESCDRRYVERVRGQVRATDDGLAMLKVHGRIPARGLVAV
ncbi:MAG: hypothetical protein ACKVGZ_16800 [Alphaproteobacteria bacterium]|jgi:hypothetical protein